MKNILLISLPRSGGHILKDTLEDYFQLQHQGYQIAGEDLTVEEMAALLNQDKQTIIGTNWNQYLFNNASLLARLIPNVNIIYLRRDNIIDQVISLALMEHVNYDPNDPTLKDIRVSLTKNAVEGTYQYINNLITKQSIYKTYINISHTFTYENVVFNKQFVYDGKQIQLLNVGKTYSYTKNPPKQKTVVNYTEVVGWLHNLMVP